MKVCFLVLILILILLQAKSARASAIYQTSFEAGDTSYNIEECDRTLVPISEINTDPQYVHSGSQSMHIIAIKDGDHQYDGIPPHICPTGTLGHQGVYWDTDTIPPYDPYNLNVTVGEAVPGQVGTWHWSGDHINATANGWVPLNPRLRITTDIEGTWDDLYTRVYVYFARLDGYLNILENMGRYPAAPHGTHTAQLHVTANSLSISPFGQDWEIPDYPGWVPTDCNENPVPEPKSTFLFEFNRWYKLEMRFFKGIPGECNGGVQVWVDDELVIDRMDLNTSGAPPQGSPWTGIVLCSNSLNFYLDDWTFSAEPINNVPFNFNVSGKLVDKNTNPISADVALYQTGTNTKDAYTSTVNGDYFLSISPAYYSTKYDLNYSNINTFLGNCWIKLLNQTVNYNLYYPINYLTEHNSKNLSFAVKTEKSQTVQSYSPNKPNRVFINGTAIEEVSSLSDLIDNTWYWNGGNLYARISPTLPFSGEILFKDNFSSGNCNNWTVVYGNWNCSNYLEGKGASEIKSIVGDAWTDYNFEATLLGSLASGSTMMLFRYDNSDNYYYFRVGMNNFGNKTNSIKLGTVDDGVDTQLAFDWYHKNTPVKFGISVNDEGPDVRIKVYINNILQYDVLTTRNHISGRVGFWTEKYWFRWDNVLVYTGPVTVFPSCSDGTLYRECSDDKPYYCDDGNLIPACFVCGCPSGKTCHEPTGNCYVPVPDNTIYFEDSFEDEEPRRFGHTFGYPPREPPINWGADTRDELGSYIEVQNTSEAAYDGDIGLYFYTPGISEPGTNDNMAGVFVGPISYTPVLYASWHQKLEVLPSGGEDIRMFLMSGGSYESLAGDLWYIGSGKLQFAKMLDNGGFSSMSVPYNMEVNKWYYFEVLYKYGITDGLYRIWVDNELVMERTGMNTTPFDGLDLMPRQFQVGCAHREASNFSCWADDVLAANYPVGH